MRKLRALAAALSLLLVAGYAFVAISMTIEGSAARALVAPAAAPYFSQKWNVFAPDISRSSRHLSIQVQWREDGELVHSDWVDVTDIELGAVRGNPVPSRLSKVSVNAMSVYMPRYRALDEEAQERARDTFIMRTDDGFAAIPDTELIDELDTEGNDRGDVVRFLRYDYMLMRYATAMGAAYFEKDAAEIERVRWRVTTQPVNDFKDRFTDENTEEPTEITFGWRQSTAVISEQVEELYAELMERYTSR